MSFFTRQLGWVWRGRRRGSAGAVNSLGCSEARPHRGRPLAWPVRRLRRFASLLHTCATLRGFECFVRGFACFVRGCVRLVCFLRGVLRVSCVSCVLFGAAFGVFCFARRLVMCARFRVTSAHVRVLCARLRVFRAQFRASRASCAWCRVICARVGVICARLRVFRAQIRASRVLCARCLVSFTRLRRVACFLRGVVCFVRGSCVSRVLCAACCQHTFPRLRWAGELHVLLAGRRGLCRVSPPWWRGGE